MPSIGSKIVVNCGTERKSTFGGWNGLLLSFEGLFFYVVIHHCCQRIRRSEEPETRNLRRRRLSKKMFLRPF
jgi:hypothetical protein